MRLCATVSAPGLHGMNTCRQCAQPITAPRGRRGPPRTYCDQRCRGRSRYRREHPIPRPPGLIAIVHECQHCGVEFHAAHRSPKYCGALCRTRENAQRMRRPPKPCPTCGTMFGARNEHVRKYCSRRCANRGSMLARRATERAQREERKRMRAHSSVREDARIGLASNGTSTSMSSSASQNGSSVVAFHSTAGRGPSRSAALATRVQPVDAARVDRRHDVRMLQPRR